MERLHCHVKEYQWGKKGEESEVARLYAAGHQDFKIGQTTPYAELWMGTHPDGPARLHGSATKLSSYIAQSESGRLLSNNNSRETIHLPFIMKIMSINHTLSLQVHPTKEQAKRLHAKDPINYPDEHHKPELAYALTRFELLCGFRPAPEMLANIEAFSSLRALFGEAHCDRLSDLLNQGVDPKGLKCRRALASMFGHMLSVQGEQLKSLLHQMLHDLDNGVRGMLTEGTVGVIRKMAKDFPGDVGIFSPLFLNHMVLQPGECCYYAAEELHAYLSGECVECVGCSNNTIRAAMTTKFIDRPALCEVLNYTMTPPEEYLVPAVTLLPAFPHVDEYAPDCRDFQLHRIRVPAGSSRLPLPVLQCPSIVVFVSGEGTIAEIENDREVTRRSITRGDIIYIAPGRSVQMLECTADAEAYRTFSYEEGPDHENRRSLKKAVNVATTIVAPSIKKISKPSFALNFPPLEPVFNVEAEMDGMV